VLTAHLRSDGSHKDKLYVDGGPSTTGTVGKLRMEGREVFKYAVGMITDVIQAAFDSTGTTADDLDWLVPHQANRRIIDGSAKKLNIDPERSSSPSICMATRRPRRSRLRLQPLLVTAASRRAISSCSRRWAAASLGAPCFCAGNRRKSKKLTTNKSLTVRRKTNTLRSST
jgi:hypothetical protein